MKRSVGSGGAASSGGFAPEGKPSEGTHPAGVLESSCEPMYKHASSPQPHHADPPTDCLPPGFKEAETLTSGISRVGLIFFFPAIPLPT